MLHGDGRESGVTDLKIAPDGSIHLTGWATGTKFPSVNPLVLDPYPSTYVPPPDDSTAAPFLAKLVPDARSILQSTFFFAPAYLTGSGSTISKNLRLVLPNGIPCLAGLRMPLDFQTPGGIVPTTATGPPTVGWSLSCEDSSGSKFNLKTALPFVGGQGYVDLAATSDGGILFTGGADGTMAATAGTLQPQYGGRGPYSYSYSSVLDEVYPGDAFVMRVNLVNPAPEIARIAPDSFILDTSASGNCSADLYGSHFAHGSVITVNGQPATGTFLDPGHTAFSFNCAVLQPGDNHVTMTMAGPGGGSSDRILTGINAPPFSISVYRLFRWYRVRPTPSL